MNHHTLENDGPWCKQCGKWIADQQKHEKAAELPERTANTEQTPGHSNVPKAYAVAAVKLAAEVDGLRAFDHKIRAVIGNTNWQCLMQRLDAFYAAPLEGDPSWEAVGHKCLQLRREIDQLAQLFESARVSMQRSSTNRDE